MRRRLLVTVMVLVAIVVVGLGIPLAMSVARTGTQRLFVDRLADTARFASLAQRPLIDNAPEALLPEMRRYNDVYGVSAALVDRDGRPLVTSRPGLDVSADRVRVALAGRRSAPYPTRMPWDTEPMLLAEPVLVDGEVRGATVVVSPTDRLRADVFADWLLLIAAGVLALGLAALAALPVVRWIMRPVQRLDSGLPKVAAAVLAGQAAEPVADGRGPAELRRLTSSFDQMAASLAQAMTAQRQFVADASHQLRNPLTALRLRLGNLEGGVETGSADEHHAAIEEADRLAEVLDGLLALARAERAPTVGERVDLDTALSERMDAWGVLAEHEGLTLSRAGDTGLSVHTPPGTVEGVLDVLIDNAIKFSPPGGAILVRVEKAPGTDGDQVVLSVRDHGPGIPPDELDRATDRFWRSPAQHNVDGSGLGLAIALSTVRRCGGDLTPRLPPGGGLEVVVRLPMEPATMPS